MTFFYDLNKRLSQLADKQDLHESKVAESEKWIQGAVNPANKGNLHKALHVAQDKTIPKAKIAKATHSKNPKLRHMAQFAKNVANEGHCPACDCSPCKCNEGNEFTGNLAKAKAAHKSEFEVDGKKYKVVEADPTGLGEDEMAEGFADMDAWLASREKEKGTGKFDKRERTLPSGMKATTYTRRHEDEPEDDSDAPVTKGGAPKKRGRPMGKPKGPERVTKGAWKHKAGRVANEEETDEGWRGGMHGEPSVVKTGKKNPNAKVEAWEGLMAIVARGQGMEPAVLKHLKQIARTLKPEELELDEEKVEAGKREFFDRIAPAAKKAAKLIKSLSKGKQEVDEFLDTAVTVSGTKGSNDSTGSSGGAGVSGVTGGSGGSGGSATGGSSSATGGSSSASNDNDQTSSTKSGAAAGKGNSVSEESTDKEDTKAERAGRKVAKDIEYDKGHKGKDDNKAEKAGKKVTKDIEYDDKKDKKDKEEKVEETTVAGSVATAPAAKKSSGGMKFGQGVYEGFNSKVENMITESMSVNVSVDDQGKKSISVNATEGDAEALAQLLKMAGLGGGHKEETCSGCGQSPCGCDAEVVDENSPDWPTNTETLDADPELRTYSGGLNGPKSTGQTTTPVIAGQLRRQASMEENVELERSLFKTWKNYKG